MTLPFSKPNAELFHHLPYIDMEHTTSPSYFLPKELLCILDRKQTQIKHKQADLRGSSKSGTSTEAANYILLEE